MIQGIDKGIFVIIDAMDDGLQAIDGKCSRLIDNSFFNLIVEVCIVSIENDTNAFTPDLCRQSHTCQIGLEVLFLHDASDFVSGFLADSASIVQYTIDGSAGHTCKSGDFFDCCHVNLPVSIDLTLLSYLITVIHNIVDKVVDKISNPK